jgi:hypothetical protein
MICSVYCQTCLARELSAVLRDTDFALDAAGTRYCQMIIDRRQGPEMTLLDYSDRLRLHPRVLLSMNDQIALTFART